MNPTDAEKLARSLMEQHGLAEPEWSFSFDPAWNDNNCYHGLKIITLSRPKVEQESISISDVRFIILHEIAHALVGPGHDHDEIWKAKDLSIGGKGERYLVDEESNRPMSDAEIAAREDVWSSDAETL